MRDCLVTRVTGRVTHLSRVSGQGGAGARGTPVGGQWSHGWPTVSVASTAHRSHGARGEYTQCTMGN